MRRILPILAILLIASATVSDPEDYPKDYFRSPLGIPLSLSGNFAEMRSNHFHSGLDIRTNRQTGYRVYAAADGYVARVSVAPGGFGHALYVNHPNGYTTVYAHLDRFEEPLASYVKGMQYERESFRVNLFPEAGTFRFSRGDVIAYSGNSGSSGGPHLHFEIRDSRTSEPLNPLLFGMPVDDETLPRIFRIRVYAGGADSRAVVMDNNGIVRNRIVPGRPADIEAVELAPGEYALTGGAVVRGTGRIAFALQAHDYADASTSRLGLYRTVLKAGELVMFRTQMERFSFGETRYINAHLDFGERATNGRWVQRSHILPGNGLRFYQAGRDGFVDIRPGDAVPMSYVIQDAYGNQSSLGFMLEGADVEAEPAAAVAGTQVIPFNRPETVAHPGLIVRFPRGALYEDLDFRYRTEDRNDGSYSIGHVLHSPNVPLHSSVTVSVDAADLPDRLRSKAVLARRTGGGGHVSVGGSFENGFVTASTRSFGTYEIAVDTIAPTVTPVNIPDGADMSRANSIRVQIRDEFSGIARFEANIDGNWVLFAYDAKRALLEHVFDGRITSGSHELTVRVVDGTGNVGRYRARFTR